MKLFGWRHRKDEELDAEIRHHLDEAIRDRIARGETPEQARANSLREFGNVGLVKETTREMWGWAWLEALGQDLRYGARMLFKAPGFTLVALLSLALGIGANTAIFSVVNSVLLRPLPYRDADKLMMLWESYRGRPGNVSVPNFLDWQTQNQVFEEMAIFRGRNVNLTGGDEPERIRSIVASASLFDVLGVSPAIGRAFSAEEDRIGGERVVVLSYGFWQTRLGADPKAVGQTLMLDGDSYTVIGVMPSAFRFPEDEDEKIWLPVAVDAQFGQYREDRENHAFQVIARLKSGVAKTQAQVEMDTVAKRIEQQHPEMNLNRGVALVTLGDQYSSEIRPTLLLLLGCVGLVLLIACANIANLLLARSAFRAKEVAIRAALGATRLRLVFQLLTESLVVAIIGGGAGLLLAVWGVDLIRKLTPGDIPRLEQISIDGQVLGFTLLLSLLTGTLFGLIPALKSSRLDLQERLKEGGRTGTATSHRFLRQSLVISEVALSLLLLIAAGLLSRSFIRVLQVNPGFNSENVLTMRLDLPDKKYPQKHQRVAFQQETIRRIQNLPGVESVGVITPLPMSGADMGLGIAIDGREKTPGDIPTARFRTINPDYFRTMQIPLLKGRFFTERDAAEAPTAIIISETMARRYWSGQDPVGRRVSLGDENWFSVVGVVGDVRFRGLEVDPQPEMYMPYAQSPMNWLFLAIRANADSHSLFGAVRNQIHELDAELPVFDVRTMDLLVTRSVAQRRFILLLMGVMAVLALVLAMVGIYGVVAYSVSQRTCELGIRMALGARQRDVMIMVLRQGMNMILIGTGIGLTIALMLTRWVSGFLYGVRATDPLTFAFITLLLIGSALLACWLPARRATKVDPLTALRHE